MQIHSTNHATQEPINPYFGILDSLHLTTELGTRCHPLVGTDRCPSPGVNISAESWGLPIGRRLPMADVVCSSRIGISHETAVALVLFSAGLHADRRPRPSPVQCSFATVDWLRFDTFFCAAVLLVADVEIPGSAPPDGGHRRSGPPVVPTVMSWASRIARPPCPHWVTDGVRRPRHCSARAVDLAARRDGQLGTAGFDIFREPTRDGRRIDRGASSNTTNGATIRWSP